MRDKALEDLSLSLALCRNTLSYNIMSVCCKLQAASCKLQACNCGRRVRAGATREFSRVKFPRCSRKEIARNNEAKEE